MIRQGNDSPSGSLRYLPALMAISYPGMGLQHDCHQCDRSQRPHTETTPQDFYQATQFFQGSPRILITRQESGTR